MLCAPCHGYVNNAHAVLLLPAVDDLFKVLCDCAALNPDSEVEGASQAAPTEQQSLPARDDHVATEQHLLVHTTDCMIHVPASAPRVSVYMYQCFIVCTEPTRGSLVPRYRWPTHSAHAFARSPFASGDARQGRP